MRRFGRFTGAVLCASAAASAQSPAQTLGASEPAAIVSAAQSCRDAITPERLDEQRLTSAGWQLAQMRGGDGRATDSPLRIFGRENVILIVMPAGPGCVVTARIAPPATYQMVMEAMVSTFGRAARASPSGEVIWMLPDNRIMQADLTGGQARPAVRIAIAYVVRNPQ